MDPNINNSNNMHASTGTTVDHFFPFDPLSSFLDSPAFPPTSTWAPPDPPPPALAPPTAAAAAMGTTSASASASAAARPSKKRSRASRRAPTTVLTTDTSNFRAMVQEFTGIPSPPFPTSAATSAAAPLHFPRFRHFLHPSSTSNSPGPLPPLNFQSLLHSQLLNLPQQPPATGIIASTSSSSGELRLPGVIGSGAGETPQGPLSTCNKLNFPVLPSAAEFNAEKGGGGGGAEGGREGLMESWICSSD